MITIVRNIIFYVNNWINWIVFKINHTEYTNISVRGLLLLKNDSILEFGSNCIINSSNYKNIIGGDTRSSIIVKKGAELLVGSNLRMSNSAIYCAESINIGDNVMIGGSCKIWDTDFHPLNPHERVENPNKGYKTRPVKIGHNVFIGGFSILLKGTTIGDCAVIGAGSVVAGDIPPGEIWAGNPAKFVKKVD